MTPANTSAADDADRNWRRFVLFRVLFNSRFYYPVLAVLFLDLGLTPSEYTLLNFAWALAIVFTDLPAGVLADRIGRKPLVVSSAVFMIMEMALLGIAPRNGGLVLLLCCFGNRILSGMAEGMASGADEALVFDSLAERGRSAEWPRVLEQVMRWQGVGLVIAMLVGGAVYDPIFMGRLSSSLGFKIHFDQALTLRFPIYLNLISAFLTLWTALGLREPGTRAMQCVPGDQGAGGAEMTAWHLVKTAGAWIVKTPAALFIIVGGVLIDSVTRLFLTFSSTYFRIIDLPEATFGIIGAALGLLGLVVSPIARRMVACNSMAKNYLLLGLAVLAGLTGAGFRWHYWGLIFVIPLWGAMMALDYIVSYYLNSLVDSSHRATVLSFNGVATNLGYGFISLLFALALRAVRNGGSTQEAVARGFTLLPAWLVFAAILCAISFRRQYRQLSVIPPAAEAAATQ
jgi:MFS family permease